jgi:hypothetical protein
MEATAAELEITPRETSTTYLSRPGALIWSFRKSRDRWKAKHQGLKASVKRLKNRAADVTKRRDLWRLKAERAATRIAALQAELAASRAEGGSPGDGGEKPRTLRT